MRHMGGVSARALVWVTSGVVLMGGCSLWPQPSTAPPVTAPVVAGRTEVGDAGSSVSGLSISEVSLGTKEMRDLSGWGDLPMAVGRPSEIRIDGAIPPAGLRITRRYEKPLPPGATATLAYFSTDLDSWVAASSELAPDRTSVSAVVHHLSWWTDFVSGSQAAMKSMGDAAVGAADWAYYNVGKVFDTRVEPPQCSSKKPQWVDTTTFIETHRNNSILFCIGRDEAKPELLTIKARVNRGFGFIAETTAKPSWTYNSSFERNDLEAAWSTVAELDKDLATSVRRSTSDGRMTAPGQEFSFGLSEAEARKQASYGALKMNPQPVLPFLVTTLGQLVGTDMTSKADGYVAAVMATAKCSKDVAAASDAGTLTRAALSCLSGIDETLAKQLAQYLLKRGVKDAGRLAGKIVGRASLYLACMGPVFNGMNYWAEQSLEDSARTVNVFPTTLPAARIVLGSGAALTLNGVRYGRGGPAEVAALVRVLGQPDKESSASCYGTKVAVRRWHGLVVYSLKERAVLDEGSGSTSEAGGVSGWLWDRKLPGTVIRGPEGINLGSGLDATLTRLRAKEYSINSEAYTIWALLGDTVSVRFDFDPSDDTVSRISSGICEDR